jgi:hypothetical protein
MPNITASNQNEAKWEIEAEIDLASNAAVSAVRGTNITATKTGTGAYSMVIKGTAARKMVEILHRDATLQGAPTGAFNARVTGISQATDGSDDITVTLLTLSNAATPAAADVTAACVLSVSLTFRAAKMGNPL